MVYSKNRYKEYQPTQRARMGRRKVKMKNLEKNSERVLMSSVEPVYTDIYGVMRMLGVCRTTALKVGEKSNAKIKLGKRSLYRIETIKAYIESLC